MMICLRGLVIAVCLAAFGASATAGDLLKEMFERPKERRVADDWFRKLPGYIEGRCKARQYPETYLQTNQKPRLRYRIKAVVGKGFRAYVMLRTGGDPEWLVTDQSDLFAWSAWEAIELVKVYPHEKMTDRQSVGFAVWLYRKEAKQAGNRVLAALHKRRESLRPAIETWVRKKEKLKDKTPMVRHSVWDLEVQKFRLLLMTEKMRDQMVERRGGAARQKFEWLRTTFYADEREVTLDALKVGLEAFPKEFKGSAYVAENQKEFDLLTALIAKALRNKSTKEMVADGAKKAKEKAEHLDQALELDPADVNLRSRVANAWMTCADIGEKNVATHRFAIENAIEQYALLSKKYAGHAGYLLALGICHQALGDTTPASEVYDRVIQLAPGSSEAKRAQLYKDQMR